MTPVDAAEGLERRLDARGLDVALATAIQLKHDILASGVRLTEGAKSALNAVRRTRSGVSGGLDLLIDDVVYVNAPVRESFVADTPYELGWDLADERWNLRGAPHVVKVDLVPEPGYYNEVVTANGRTADQLGQMCSADRFCYGITGPSCRFWPESERCRYCSIGLNHAEDGRRKQVSELINVLGMALEDAQRPARHLLLGGGTPNSADMGARMCAELCREVKAEFGIPIYVMIAAPLRNESIDELYESGADELGINLEFWSPDSWDRYIPGKERLIGRDRYLDAISYSGELFGPIRSRSIMITGLESEDSTIDGVKFLVDAGVMPILSPFRPLDGTALETSSPPTPAAMESVLVRADEIAHSAGLPIGPVCAPCQNNVLAMPPASIISGTPELARD